MGCTRISGHLSSQFRGDTPSDMTPMARAIYAQYEKYRRFRTEPNSELLVSTFQKQMSEKGPRGDDSVSSG